MTKSFAFWATWSVLASGAAIVAVAAGLPWQTAANAAVVKTAPAVVEAIPGSTLKKITLTQRAAERIGVKTAAVVEELRPAEAGQSAATPPEKCKVVPYSAVLYDVDGSTWVYTSSAPLSYVRQAIKIETIAGNKVMLAEGPAIGTEIVITGAVQIFGAEFKVGGH